MNPRRLAMRAALLAALLAPAGPAPLGAQAMDSLLAAAQRIARAWQRHDFQAVVGDAEVAIQFPGGNRSAPLRPAQAAELLRADAAGSSEIQVEVLVARDVDGDRAYVELERVFAMRGTGSRRRQTVYLGLRREGGAYRLAEIRIVP